MSTTQLMLEIQRLSMRERMFIVERTIKLIMQAELKQNMEKAADMLLEDYENDKELTTFTDIDLVDFYEAR